MSTRQETIDLILDHYDNPRNYGPMQDADVVATGRNPGCGDLVTVYLKVGPGEQTTAVSFEGKGCTISQAAASITTDLVVGKTLGELLEIDHQVVADDLGNDVVGSRLRCATLALNTLKSAVARYQAGDPPQTAAEAPVENF
ncbi:MAG: iron-sulfur cluster assembly scaffold protein [Chloroflexota bacterium]